MKHTARSLLSPLLSAGLLYLVMIGFNVLAAVVIPWLFELQESAPRLAALAWLGLFCSPIAFVAIVHRAAHAVMDHLDAGDTVRRGPGMASLWAGLFAWFAMFFASLASAFLFMAIFPPPVDERTFAKLIHVVQDVRLELGVHAALWLSVAALLYHVEKRARG